MDLTNPATWTDEHGYPYYLLRVTLLSYKHGETERERAEALACVRALAALIDPPLYYGAAYGLLIGNRVWGALFQRVREIVAYYTTDVDQGTRTTRMDALGSIPYAAESLAKLAETWPTTREEIPR